LKVVDEEVAKANAILNNPEATAEEVENAINGLTKAMAGLEANSTNLENTVKPGDTTVNATKTGDTTNMMYPLAGLAIAALGFYSNKKRRKID
ncbi:MAG: LPXTG cell wall anchor domain-containing protein, partial [Thomasclavelia sp.]|uniref:LPXTG cell wall anchor domain-containing protein n=1 Tax=Thomasclavelia sp. TaxID=3025757 RepID=UPI0039A0B915